MTQYDISHPSHLKSNMESYPKAYLSLGRPREIVRHRTNGGPRADTVPCYQLIHPGEVGKDYFCRSVKPEAVHNMEDCNELELVKEGRWRLRSSVGPQT